MIRKTALIAAVLLGATTAVLAQDSSLEERVSDLEQALARLESRLASSEARAGDERGGMMSRGGMMGCGAMMSRGMKGRSRPNEQWRGAEPVR